VLFWYYFETVFTLERFYKQPRVGIRDALLPLLGLPGIILPGKSRFSEIFDLYVERILSFADAYHVVLARSLKLDLFLSFDRGIDRVPGIKRVEP
jgi:predicted nucleic acid-binding protein